jgi:hypothetical protein
MSYVMNVFLQGRVMINVAEPETLTRCDFGYDGSGFDNGIKHG